MYFTSLDVEVPFSPSTSPPSLLLSTGKGRPRGAHEDGFVYVTSLGYTNYCSASSLKDHEEWMSWMRTALDMALGTEGAVDDDISVTRHARHMGLLEPPKHQESEVR